MDTTEMATSTGLPEEETDMKVIPTTIPIMMDHITTKMITAQPTTKTLTEIAHTLTMSHREPGGVIKVGIEDIRKNLTTMTTMTIIK